jgi:putative effector of murein hydrolase LrgA (UPF0299 family)
MAKKKKTVLSFLLLITAIYGFFNIMKDVSQEFEIPLPILILGVLLLYLLWSDEED